LSWTGRASRPLARPGQLPIRFAFATALTAYLFWKSHPRDILTAIASADWRFVAFAVLLVLLDRGLMAYRWIALLCTIQPQDRPPLEELMRIFFVSTFVGTFLPATIGSDVLRSYSMSRLRVNPADSVASVLMDRILGIASILIMSAVGLLLAREFVSNLPILVALAGTALVCAVAALLVFWRPFGTGSETRSAGSPIALVRYWGTRVVDSLQKYAHHRGVLINVLAGSVLVQGLRIVQAYLLGRGLGIDLSVAAYFAFIPFILLVMLLPVTINGIGTSQAAFVWFFGQAGVSPALAFTLSVLFVALGIAGNLPGAFLWVLGRSATAERVPMRPGPGR
jgi:uncharacterized protein (TIRG00374 family)